MSKSGTTRALGPLVLDVERTVKTHGIWHDSTCIPRPCHNSQQATSTYVLHAAHYFEALTGTLILNLPPEAIPFGGVFFFANQCLKAWRLIKMYVENHVPQLQVVWWWWLVHRVVFCLCLGDRKRSLQRSMQTWVAPDSAPWVRLRLWRVEARVLAVWNHGSYLSLCNSIISAYHTASH